MKSKSKKTQVDGKQVKGSFFESSITEENEFHKFNQFLEWFHSKKIDNRFVVNKIPFHELDKWFFNKETSNLFHSSGKFFTIEGLSIRTNFGEVGSWEQPIINQPEIGILGIITKVINNIRYFLMQAKMEPGNISILQLSPTVQATKSNYTKVHKGKLPTYLEYFVDKSKSRILVDQLQPEQGSCFLRKRNRNMIVEIVDDIRVYEDFCWLTLNELKKLFLIDNFVNMDARSVLATIYTIYDDEIISSVYNYDDSINLNGYQIEGYKKDVIVSIIEKNRTWKSLDALISWLTNLKTYYELHINSIPLNKVKNWVIGSNEIKHISNRFFSVIAVSVEADTREVTSWTQPLLAKSKIGLIGFLTTKISGILHYLVQGKVEPGNYDVVDIAPTVSCSDIKRNIGKRDDSLPFLDFFVNVNHNHIRYSTIQSEEGGRFYHFQNRNMIIEVEQLDINDIPENYAWMTLGQMLVFQRFGMLNIETRNLISFINLL